MSEEGLAEESSGQEEAQLLPRPPAAASPKRALLLLAVLGALPALALLVPARRHVLPAPALAPGLDREATELVVVTTNRSSAEANASVSEPQNLTLVNATEVVVVEADPGPSGNASNASNDSASEAPQAPVSTEGCYFAERTAYSPLDMPGTTRSIEATMLECQERCAKADGCAYFSYWDDGGCHLQDATAKPRRARSLAAGPGRWPERCLRSPLLVRNLFTLGAPSGAYPPLTNPGGGCIPGLRVYTENEGKLGGKDADAAVMVTNFPHPKTPVLALRGAGQESVYVPCPGQTRWPLKYTTGDRWSIHGVTVYQERLTRSALPNAKERKVETAMIYANFTGFTYKISLPELRQAVREVDGWRLVGKIEHLGYRRDVDRVLLVQNEASLGCALGFQGSDNAWDFTIFIQSYGTDFCGFGNSHAGIRNELWRLTEDAHYQQLKPKLAKCSYVDCVGHSLGGSLCNLWTACANSGRRENADYQQLAWTPAATPELMPEL